MKSASLSLSLTTGCDDGTYERGRVVGSLSAGEKADDPALWHVMNEDGDEEDLNDGELRRASRLYVPAHSNANKKRTQQAMVTQGARSKRRQAVSEEVAIVHAREHITHGTSTPLNMSADEAVATAAAEGMDLNKWRSAKSISGYRGVTFLTGGRYKVQMCVDGKTKYLGSFDTAEQAALVYARRHTKLHGTPAVEMSADEAVAAAVAEGINLDEWRQVDNETGYDEQEQEAQRQGAEAEQQMGARSTRVPEIASAMGMATDAETPAEDTQPAPLARILPGSAC